MKMKLEWILIALMVVAIAMGATLDTLQSKRLDRHTECINALVEAVNAHTAELASLKGGE